MSATITMHIARSLLIEAGYFVRCEEASPAILAVYTCRHGELLAKLNVDQNRHCERILVIELIERIGR